MVDFPTTLVPTDGAAPTTALGDVAKNHTDHHQGVDERLGLLQAALSLGALTGQATAFLTLTGVVAQTDPLVDLQQSGSNSVFTVDPLGAIRGVSDGVSALLLNTFTSGRDFSELFFGGTNGDQGTVDIFSDVTAMYLQIKASVAQTDPLLDLQDSDGTTVMQFLPAAAEFGGGDLYIGDPDTGRVDIAFYHHWSGGISGRGSSLDFPGANNANLYVEVQPDAALLRIRGATAQTDPLLDLQDSDADSLYKVTPGTTGDVKAVTIIGNARQATHTGTRTDAGLANGDDIVSEDTWLVQSDGAGYQRMIFHASIAHDGSNPASYVQSGSNRNGYFTFSNGPSTFIEVAAELAVAERQQFDQTGGASGGDYTLDNDGNTIGPINYNDDNTAVQAAWDAGLGAAVVTITGDATSFTADWAATGPIPMTTLADNSLTGGSAPDVTILRTRLGCDVQTANLFTLYDPDFDTILFATPTAISTYNATGLEKAARPAVPTQVAVVSVSDFNAIRTAMIALGIWTDGD